MKTDKLFSVKEEDRSQSQLPALIACVGAAYISIQFFITFYNTVSNSAYSLPLEKLRQFGILVFHIGLVMLAASLLLRGETFVKLRTAALVTVSVSAAAVFITHSLLFVTSSYKFLSLLRCFATYGSVAAAGMMMLLATYDRVRAVGPLISFGTIALDFTYFLSSHGKYWTAEVDFSGIDYHRTSYSFYSNSAVESFSFMWFACVLVLLGVMIPMFKYFTRPDPKPQPQPQPQVVTAFAQQGQPAVYYQNGQPIFTQPQYYEPGKSVMYKPLEPQAYILNGRPVRTPAQQIAELNDLRARGLITEQEFQNKRVEILDEL